MTKRLYYDSDLLVFDANVIAHDGDDCRVILDQSAFYPTSGGQPHDTGAIGGVPVIDVVDAGDQVVHLCQRSVPLGPASCEVDPERRNDFTVQHSAQHLLSALAADRYGWDTVSVHFGDQRSLIEFDVAQLTLAQLVELEHWANELVAEAVPVSVGYEEATKTVGLRKPSKRVGSIRVVTIPGIDRSACGGTHVTNTAQLGSVLVRGVERMRGNCRVGFLAGRRALTHSRQVEDTLNTLVGVVGAPEAELVELVSGRLEALRDAGKRIAGLERELARHRIQALISEVPTGSGGVRWLELREEALPVAALRQLAAAAADQVGVVLVAASVEFLTVCIAANSQTEVDAGSRLRTVLSELDGKGGGSAQFAQGTLPSVAALDKALQLLRTES